MKDWGKKIKDTKVSDGKCKRASDGESGRESERINVERGVVSCLLYDRFSVNMVEGQLDWSCTIFLL